MPITKTEGKFFNELVRYCITSGLEEKEAKQYLEVRFKPVSLSLYKHRKARLGGPNDPIRFLLQDSF